MGFSLEILIFPSLGSDKGCCCCYGALVGGLGAISLDWALEDWEKGRTGALFSWRLGFLAGWSLVVLLRFLSRYTGHGVLFSMNFLDTGTPGGFFRWIWLRSPS